MVCQHCVIDGFYCNPAYSIVAKKQFLVVYIRLHSKVCVEYIVIKEAG